MITKNRQQMQTQTHKVTERREKNGRKKRSTKLKWKRKWNAWDGTKWNGTEIEVNLCEIYMKRAYLNTHTHIIFCTDARSYYPDHNFIGWCCTHTQTHRSATHIWVVDFISCSSSVMLKHYSGFFSLYAVDSILPVDFRCSFWEELSFLTAKK